MSSKNGHNRPRERERERESPRGHKHHKSHHHRDRRSKSRSDSRDRDRKRKYDSPRREKRRHSSSRSKSRDKNHRRHRDSHSEKSSYRKYYLENYSNEEPSHPNPESLDFPYCKYHISQENVLASFKEARNIHPDAIENHGIDLVKITGLQYRNLLNWGKYTLAGFQDAYYWKTDYLLDYFNEDMRINMESKHDVSIMKCWNRNKAEIIKEMKRSDINTSIRNIKDFLYSKYNGYPYMRPWIVKYIGNELNISSVLDFDSGLGEVLLGSLAYRIDYLGFAEKNCFSGFKNMIAQLSEGKIISNPDSEDVIESQNQWNTFKVIFDDFLKADVGTFTYDLIMGQVNEKFSDLNLLYKYLDKAWERLRSQGCLALNVAHLVENANYKLQDLIRWIENNLRHSKFSRAIPFGINQNKKWHYSDIIMIWEKTTKENPADLYYIGDLKCKKIEVDSLEELEKIISQKITSKNEDTLFIGDESQHHLNYGTVFINKNRFKVKKYINFTIEDLNPKSVIQDITAGQRTFKLASDHLLPGGTKQRGIDFSQTKENQIVYAGPYNGYAQVVLGISGKIWDKKSIMFASKNDYSTSLKAIQWGTEIKIVPHGGLKQLMSAAKEYSEKNNALNLEFGFGNEAFSKYVEVRIKECLNGVLDYENFNKKVWVVAGSATLLNVMYKIFPNATFGAIQVGKTVWPDQIEFGKRTKLYVCNEKFQEPARVMPPYVSGIRYDSKAWQFIVQDGGDGDLIWNVAE